MLMYAMANAAPANPPMSVWDDEEECPATSHKQIP